MPEELVTGAPAAPAAPAAPVAPSNPNPAPVTPAPAQANSGVDQEARFKGIQADLAKERKQRQTYEAQVADYKTKLEAETRRVQALAGVAPVSADDAEAEEIRTRFSKVITPDYLLKQLGLSKEEIEEFKAAKADRASLQETTQHYWAKHGQGMVRKVSSELAKEYGGELSTRQQDTITKAYIFRAQQDPEFLKRHEDGDESLITEFAQEWIQDWAEPARRKALATEVNSFRRVPNGQNRGIVNNGEKKIDVNDPKAVEDLLVAGFKERNPGGFGRR
jgi:hypothetical protein